MPSNPSPRVGPMSQENRLVTIRLVIKRKIIEFGSACLFLFLWLAILPMNTKVTQREHKKKENDWRNG